MGQIFFFNFLFINLILTSQAADLLSVAGGVFSPVIGKQAEIKVLDFLLDETPVTNHDYLEFLVANEKWQKSKAHSLFRDQQYLNHWIGDVELGDRAPLDSPVVNVSWFAAKAYCEYRGKRLPRVVEWEYVGQFGPVGISKDVQTIILEWYAKLSPDIVPSVRSTFKNKFGVWDIHGLIWEWTEDFNSSFVTGESRADSSLDKAMFCGAGAMGAKDATNYAAYMRFALRSSLKANYALNNLGFRCARGI